MTALSDIKARASCSYTFCVSSLPLASGIDFRFRVTCSRVQSSSCTESTFEMWTPSDLCPSKERDKTHRRV